jgi:hypothetical protein
MRTLETMVPVVLLVMAGFVGEAVAAGACGCLDAETLRQRAERAGKAEEAWKQIAGWAAGLRGTPPKPESQDALNARFGQLMNAPQPAWADIMRQPVDVSAVPKNIGSTNVKGEPVIDQDITAQSCDEIVQGMKLREDTHKRFYQTYAPAQTRSTLAPGLVLQVRAEAEVVSNRAEKEFLNGKVDELRRRCTVSAGTLFASATTENGITYTATRCDRSPWGTWMLVVSGAMSGRGTLTISENSGTGAWSANASVPGAGMTISQTGGVQYLVGPSPQLRLTTNVASARGVTANPGRFLDLPVSFSDRACSER